MKTDKVCGALLLAASAACASEWRVSRSISGDAAERATVAAVNLDEHVFANSLSDLADVRVLDAQNREVPRVIQAERDYTFEQRHTPREARVKSVEQLPDGGLSVVCEVERTNAVSLTRVQVRTPLRNYEQTVTVYVQDATGAWSLVKGAEPLFDYSRFADVKKETVELPVLTNRLFKLVIGQADDKVFSSFTALEEDNVGGVTARQFKRYSVERRPFRIDAVIFSDTERVAVEKERRERVRARDVSVTEDAEHKTTVLTIRTERCPVVGIAFVPEQQNCERKITVECPAPGGWRFVEAGAISRSHLPGLTPRDNLEIGFWEIRAEHVRVQIRNDDNPPLTFREGGVTLVRQAYKAVFIAEKGQRYRLAYGNPEVKSAPVYEQGVTAYLRRGQKAEEWQLAPAPEGKVTYGTTVRARQFLAKRGMLLFSALVMAVLGVLIWRAVGHVETDR